MTDKSIDEARQSRKRARQRIDDQVVGNADALRRLNENHSGWALNLYPEAREASGSFRSSTPNQPTAFPSSRLFLPNSPESAEARTRSLQESGRSARRQIRRYCAPNKLNRLITLTCAGHGCFDQSQLRDHLAEFVRNFRCEVGTDFPCC